MSNREEESYTPLRTACDKFKDLIADIGKVKEISSENINRLDDVGKEIVSSTSAAVEHRLKDKIVEINGRVKPLLQETEDLLKKVERRNLERTQGHTKKLFSRRHRKKQNLEG
tara:strand:+ start:543 stop:881 length:339 start_codon:yes stop_codon:yes gene_type:complete